MLIFSTSAFAPPEQKPVDIELRPCELAAQTPVIPLLPPTNTGPSLEHALQHRRSERRFSEQPLSLQQLSQLLWAAQGITHGRTKRTAPSSGGAYPIDLYVFIKKLDGLDCGLYRYEPTGHRLTLIDAADYSKALTIAASNQSWVGNAAIVIMHVATPARVAAKYGDKTALPSSLLEAGHISQNIYLQATALGLAALGMNGFRQPELDELLGLQSDQTVLFINLAGRRPG